MKTGGNNSGIINSGIINSGIIKLIERFMRKVGIAYYNTRGDRDTYNFDGNNYDFSGYRFSDLILSGWKVMNCKFEGAEFTDSVLRTSFSRCNFNGAKFNNVGGQAITNSTFVGSELIGVRCEFRGCIFIGGLIDGASGEFNGCRFESVHFGNNNVARLRDIISVGAQFSEGADEDARRFNEEIREAEREVEEGIKFEKQEGEEVRFVEGIREHDGRRYRLWGGDFAGGDLAGGEFIGCNLDGADFSRADMRGAKFQNCRLVGAKLDGGIFEGNENLFNNCDMRQVSIRDTDLSYVEFQDCELADADFEGSDLEGAIFSGSQLVGATKRYREAAEENANEYFMGISKVPEELNLQSGDSFVGGEWHGGVGNVKRVDFSGIDLRRSQYRKEVRGCRFDGADMREILSSSKAEWISSTFIGVNFGGSALGGKFSGCDFGGADMRGVTFMEAEMTLCNFEGTRFDEGVKGVTFTRCKGIEGEEAELGDRHGDRQVEFFGDEISGYDFSNLKFNPLIQIKNGARYKRCNFMWAEIWDVIYQVKFIGCRLDFAKFGGRDKIFNIFIDSILDRAEIASGFSGTVIKGSSCKGIRVSGRGAFNCYTVESADFSDGEFGVGGMVIDRAQGSNFGGAEGKVVIIEARGCNFDEADIKVSGGFFDSTFRGSKLRILENLRMGGCDCEGVDLAGGGGEFSNCNFANGEVKANGVMKFIGCNLDGCRFGGEVRLVEMVGWEVVDGVARRMGD